MCNKENYMSSKASGKCEIKKDSEPFNLNQGNSGTIKYYGELEATAKCRAEGFSRSLSPESPYWIDTETIYGDLQGRKGSFVLQCIHTIKNTPPDILVVSGSGTEELTGLTGRMTIHYKEENFYYEFNYALSEST
jgi:Protein of unknown function (DUF3224)